VSIQSQSAAVSCNEEHLPEAENPTLNVRSLSEIISDKAVFQRREGTMKTKPSIFDNPNVLPRLAMAFSIGGSVEEAALFAGYSASVVKKHMRERTQFQTTTPWGENCITTFDEMVNGWRTHIGLLAKLAIYKSLFDPKEGIKSAWKLLERRQPETYGGICRDCLRRGVKVF
jgi:hypothetical protein